MKWDFIKARKFARKLKLKTYKEWLAFCRGEYPKKGKLPEGIPAMADASYEKLGWISWGDWLGTETVAARLREYLPFEEAREFVRSLKLKTQEQWIDYCKGRIKGMKKPDNIPAGVPGIYRTNGWISMGDWLGTGKVSNSLMQTLPFPQAREFVRSLGLKSQKQWQEYIAGRMKHLPTPPEGIPYSPARSYADKGWAGMGDWIGTGTVAPQMRKFMIFEDARAFARSLNLKTKSDWEAFSKGKMNKLGKLPNDVPAGPSGKYQKDGWISWGDWLGTGATPKKRRKPS